MIKNRNRSDVKSVTRKSAVSKAAFQQTAQCMYQTEVMIYLTYTQTDLSCVSSGM